MVQRIAALVSAVVLIIYNAGLVPVAAQASAARDSAPGLACFTPTDHPVRYSTGMTDVLVCTSTIQSGSTLHLVVYTRRPAAVQAQLLFPDGSTAPTSGPLTATSDKKGIARLSIFIQYNPVTGYAPAKLTVTAARPGKTDVVSGTVTVAQAVPLLTTKLRARPGYRAGWCPEDRLACSVRNNSNLVVLVDSDPGAQVAITLRYPDDTVIQFPQNELTSNSLTDANGVYRCQLPIVYQPKNSDSGKQMTVTAQVSLNGYTQTKSLTLTLITR